MFDPIRSRTVPFAALPDSAEALLREYLDHLFGSVNLDRVRDSCARERALACVAHGMVGPLADRCRGALADRDLAEIAFGELEDRLGWFDDDAAVLGVYAGAVSTADDGAHEAARERYLADSYRRHGTYWHRCEEAGYADFLEWCEDRECHDHAAALAAVDGAAAAVGDE